MRLAGSGVAGTIVSCVGSRGPHDWQTTSDRAALDLSGSNPHSRVSACPAHFVEKAVSGRPPASRDPSHGPQIMRKESGASHRPALLMAHRYPIAKAANQRQPKEALSVLKADGKSPIDSDEVLLPITASGWAAASTRAAQTLRMRKPLNLPQRQVLPLQNG
jgi:hypothetical protein